MTDGIPGSEAGSWLFLFSELIGRNIQINLVNCEYSIKPSGFADSLNAMQE